MSEKCIVHYDGYGEYSKLKLVTSQTESRMKEAKEYRCKLGGENQHDKQCDSIPEVFNHDEHMIHLDPCYKKFTKILSDKKRREQQTPTAAAEPDRRSNRLSSPGPSHPILYPNECFFCKSKSKKHRGTIDKKLITITTSIASNSIKKAAEEKHPEIYIMIKDEDLIAKEMKYHRYCYKNFTLGFGMSFQSNTNKNDSNSQTSEEGRESGNYEAVKDFIINHVVSEKRAVSMKKLHAIYGLKNDDVRYRGKLKQRIMRDFHNEIQFLKPSNGQMSEIVTCINISIEEFDFNSNKKQECVIAAAGYLRQEILNYSENLPELNWPPNIEELTSNERNPPPILLTFMKELLLNKNNRSTIKSENISRLIDSYCADLIHGVTRGKVITAKHFLTAMGLHNLTGMRKVIDITNRLGHCLPYHTVCDIETALAQKAQILATIDTALNLKPLLEGDFVLTTFWADNFDAICDKQNGGGSINTTHLLAFQEVDANTTENNETPDVPFQKSRVIIGPEIPSEEIIVNPKKEPPLIATTEVDTEFNWLNIRTKYLTWIWLRHHNRYDQIIPNFSGWLLQHREPTNLLKTVLTYLPPITSKVTEFSTIIKYMDYLQQLAFSVNMPFVNITLDVGAAINAYKLLWNKQDRFSNVVIHLGDFHFMKENFQVSLSSHYEVW